MAGVTKSKLIETLSSHLSHLSYKDVELAVKLVLEHISQELARGRRVEIRGFGSFSLRHRPARMGRNPRTGESVYLSSKYVPSFKPGKNLRIRVDTRHGTENTPTA